MALDFKSIRRAALDQGWDQDATTKGHPRFIPPDKTKPVCVFSGTPSDQRAIKNFLATMKRSGLIWPWNPKRRGE
jgi:hypothetical protein